ncbi:MAG: hypothetical protein Kow0042_29710 [Calditrichia bacterium]
MPNLKTATALQMLKNGVQNILSNRPLAMSLEITHSCNCDCQHCDKGGVIKGEELAPPQRFGELVRELKPLIAQVSGGEPLSRKDVYEIIGELKVWGKLPYIVLVTNARLLTEEKYLRFKELGVDEFSISLDFPDERHDANRRLPGLYRHLEKLLPKLAAYGNGDITLISVIRKETLPELPALADHALRWNVYMNFSAYTPLRTNDRSKSIQGAEELALLREQIDYLIDFKRKTGRIFTTESTLNRYYDFFASNSYLPNCRAGYRSLVVNPDGRLAPCAMQPYAYQTREELINNFSKNNSCGGCYVSLRANTEKSVKTLLKDGWLSLLQMRRNSNHSPS